MSILVAELEGRSALPTIITEAGGAFASLTAAHAAGDSFKFLSYTARKIRETAPRRDVRPGRDDITVLLRDWTVEFECTTQFLPRGTNVPPDCAPLIVSGVGAETIGGGSVTYGYSRVPSSFGLIVTGGESTPVAQQKLVGGLVNETVLTLAKNQEPQRSFSGIGARLAEFMGTTLIGAGANNATQNLTANTAVRLEQGNIAEVVGVQTNLRVASRNVPGHTVTFDSSIDTGAGGQIVRPYTPWSESSANQGGEPIASYIGSLSIAGSSAYAPIGAQITINHGWREKRSLFSEWLIDAGVGHREITGTMTFNARDTELALIAMANYEVLASSAGALNPVAVVFTLGQASTGQVVITMPQVVLLPSGPLAVQAEGDATIELAFFALSTRTSGVPNNDAYTEVWS